MILLRAIGALFSSPLRAAILVGLVITIALGFASLPETELKKSVSSLNPARILSGSEGDQLHQAYQAARAGDGEVIDLSEDEFKNRGFPFAASFPADQSGNRFVLRHVGQDELGDSTVYVWEETIFAAPWWSPHRFVYKAVEAETGAFGEVVRLTYERDVSGLLGMLAFDATIGVLYGLIVGLIVAVKRTVLEAPLVPERRSNQVTSWSPAPRPAAAATRRIGR